MRSQTLSGCPSVTDSEVSTVWRSGRGAFVPRRSASGKAAAAVIGSVLGGVHRRVRAAAPGARPHALAGRLQAQRERAAVHGGVLGEHLVAAAARLLDVGGA